MYENPKISKYLSVTLSVFVGDLELKSDDDEHPIMSEGAEVSDVL